MTKSNTIQITVVQEYDIGDLTDLVDEQIYDLVSDCVDHFSNIDSYGTTHNSGSIPHVPNIVVCVSEKLLEGSLTQVKEYLTDKYGDGSMGKDNTGDNVFFVNDVSHVIKF